MDPRTDGSQIHIWIPEPTVPGSGTWVAEGRIAHRVDITEGLEHAPDALDRLFTGANLGKTVVRVR